MAHLNTMFLKFLEPIVEGTHFPKFMNR